ncbi:diacylglycerol kinase epsilon [Pieris napi]|uniref:diacylglycerol kinase epsilon n=1 Tax=Pieris napi TaxID=78633 RepID=UPI001FBAEC7F|nr:diacylglycerol kinase epsilon [Pieris napi]
MNTLFDLPNVIFNYYFVIGGLFIAYLIYRTFHSLIGTGNFIQIKYKSRGHTWRNIQCHNSNPYNIYCSVCSKLMLPVDGLYCECCAVSACKLCCRSVDKQVKCKDITWRDEKPFPHLWVNVGMLRGESGQSDSESFKNYFCSWCQRIIKSHEMAFFKSKPCDFQKYKNIIIPPHYVKIEKNKVININNINDVAWNPLIVFANRKSGSNRSDEVLSLFRGLLNPLQVIDISRTAPDVVVRWLPPKCRVLVAGGDGTVGWVLNALHKVPHIKASVGILPMGTGNDLSRALGWGATCDSVLDAHSIIDSLIRAVEKPLDRWKVTITPKRRSLGRLRGPRVLYAYNYASIGVDAQVALDFHHAREQFLYRFANQTLNYVAYLVLGVGRALDDGGCFGLERRMRVYAPTQLSLPPLQALVALNIPSWGAGVDLWSMGSEEVPEQSMNDRKLEVVGISSSFHIARLQCGLAEPFRFTQASDVRIELEGSCAMQVDGEPWMQGPATILIQHAGQSMMLVPS